MSDAPIPELDGKPPPRTLVRASAGTGKTHTLTGRMLGALLEPGGMDDPARVLATTFTRKAAGEILNRLLERLLEAAHIESKRRELEKQTEVPRPPAAYEHAAVELARRMDRLRVMTIDALLFRMARAAGLDLEMAPGWRLADDADERAIRRAALEAALAAGDSDDSGNSGDSGQGIGALSHDEVIELVRDAGRRPMSAGVLASLDRLVADAHPVFLECTRGAVEISADSGLQQWSHVGPESEPLDAGALAGAVARLRGATLPTSGKGADQRPDARFEAAVSKIVEAIHGADWEAAATHTLMRAAGTPGGAFYRKAVDGDLAEALRVLGAHAASHVLADLRRRNEAAGRLLARYESCLWSARRASGAVGFGEVTRLLVWSDVLDNLGDLWYRLDAGLSTLLIDEAQDTSLLQFRMLAPLLDELLSTEEAGRGVLVVGDPKQSLYAWRQAEAELMEQMGVRWRSLEPRTLSASWRSGRVVLDAVNAVFGSLGSCACLARDDRPGLRRAADEFVERYDQHRPGERDAGTDGKVADELGLVQVWTLPSEEDGEGGTDTQAADADADASEPGGASSTGAPRTGRGSQKPKPDMARGVVEAVRRLLAEAGDTPVGIGVLVRTNKPIRTLVRALRDAGIDATEEGGAPLSDDPLVAGVLSLLHLADHPGDTLCAYHVAMTPVGRAIGWHGVPSGARVRRRAMRLRRALASRGWATVLERLVERIAAIDGVPEASVARLWQMLGLVREFEATAPVRTGPLVEMIAERRVASGGQARVRVMTIHAAKGLEFDAVVLPELDRTWGGRGGALMARQGTLGEVTAASLGVRREIAELHPDLREMVRQRDRREAFEGLCTLYVAMTRAKRALVMLMGEYDDSKAKPDSAASAARVVRAGLRTGQQVGQPAGRAAEPLPDAAGPGEAVYERRNGNWWARPGAKEPSVRGPAQRPIEACLAEPTHASLRRARVVSPSSLEGRRPEGDGPVGGLEDGEPIALGARFAVGSPPSEPCAGPSARDLGTIVHAMLASIEWLDEAASTTLDGSDPSLREAAMVEFGRRQLAGDAEALIDAGLAMLQQALGTPGSHVRTCLTRAWSLAGGTHGPHVSNGSRAPLDPVTPEVRREWAFLCQDEPGPAIDPSRPPVPRMLSGTIDRLVLTRGQGATPGAPGPVVRADVIDFKTDRLASPDELAERVAHYSPQVRAYQRAVARMFALPPERVRGVLVFVAAGEVVEVTE
ncbi:MAG: UvrD-helicase domain-containing protein [Phycisphaerales bacterium]